MTIASPCIKICALDASGRCLGCGRSLDEIARWLTISAAERQAIMEALPARLATMRRGMAEPVK